MVWVTIEATVRSQWYTTVICNTLGSGWFCKILTWQSVTGMLTKIANGEPLNMATEDPPLQIINGHNQSIQGFFSLNRNPQVNAQTLKKNKGRRERERERSMMLITILVDITTSSPPFLLQKKKMMPRIDP